MKIYLVMLLALIITTIGYAQDSTVLKVQAQKTCIWNDTLRDWNCPDILYKEENSIINIDLLNTNKSDIEINLISHNIDEKIARIDD